MTADYEIHTIENFPFSNNFDRYENSKGEIWVLSSSGIYVVKANDLVENGKVVNINENEDNTLMSIPALTTWLKSNGAIKESSD